MTTEPNYDLTREDYARAERFLPWHAQQLVFNAQVKPNWVDKADERSEDRALGDRFWYLNQARYGQEFVLIDPENNTRALAFDHAKLAAALSTTLGRAFEPFKLPFKTFKFVREGRAIEFEVGDQRLSCDLETYQCTVDGEKEPEPPGERRSPDGQWAAFVKEYNLYVRAVDDEAEIPLTDDGEPYYDYGTSPEANTMAVTLRLAGKPLPPVAKWSPDSKKLVTHKLDQRQVDEMHLLQSVPQDGGVRPVVHAYRYPMPGDEHVPLAELVILDVEKRTKVSVDYEPLLAPYVSPLQLKNVWWSADSARVYFIFKDRGDKELRLCEVDADTGATRSILEERLATFVETHLMIGSRPNVRDLSGGDEIIWFSERDGWPHLYLYDGKNGELKNQITSGPWAVRDILHVDEEQRLIYFTAGGREQDRDPYFCHLYRIGLDGAGLQLLTPEDADHTVTFSPTGKYFVDTYSRVDAVPVTVLRTSEGKLVRKLEEADVELVVAMGWGWPERFSVKARDGVTDLYGMIYRPTHFDPAKQYPVIDSIYPGPQVIRTPKAFPADPYAALGYWEPQAIAELGFIVVTIDGLGTPFRSKAFHDQCFGNLGEAGGLEDHIVGLRQLASSRPYMDLSRVGIYGHSGGGFASARAILMYPDFYKVAVSSAGNHDQRGYLSDWGEKYQGLFEATEDGSDNYQNQVTANLAKNLKGKLLLVYGDMDDNVQPALTIQLVDALIKANKDFDLLVLPNRNHMFTIDPYFNRKKWDYLVQHLLEARPPKEYAIKGIDPRLLASLMEERLKEE